MLKTRLLLDPGAGGGGAAPASLDFNTLPEDIRADPTLMTIKTIPDLAKGYVNAQKLIGAKRFALPEPSWKPEQYAEHWKNLGRPDKPDDYANTDTIKLADGIVIDGDRMKAAKAKFHEMGLSAKQGQAMLDLYYSELNDTHGAMSAAHEKAINEGTMKLKTDWGDKYDQNLDVAVAVLKKFDKDGSIKARLDQTGLGNDPEVVKFFYELGRNFTEDTIRGKGLLLAGPTQAAQEIEQLKQNKEFMDAYLSREHPGHQAAIDKWIMLHERAYPGKQQDAA